jgi:hypothetical protein
MASAATGVALDSCKNRSDGTNLSYFSVTGHSAHCFTVFSYLKPSSLQNGAGVTL